MLKSSVAIIMGVALLLSGGRAAGVAVLHHAGVVGLVKPSSVSFAIFKYDLRHN